MADTPRASVIIRTLNEERWIDACLAAVYQQDYPDIEVVLVDNRSTDRTLDIVSRYPVVLETIDEFRPGLALNVGVRAASGEVLVFISGHCVPVDDQWLPRLVAGLADAGVAGVYGRQEPLSYTSDLDKRDLLTVFGRDPKVQTRDSFFHNANSAMRRETWEHFPFDEDATNVEDRIWGQQVIAAGLKILYEPDASVYHWHGINHASDPDRARNVVRVLETIPGVTPDAARLERRADHRHRALAVVPIMGASRTVAGRPLLAHTIDAALASDAIDEVLVASDDADTAELATSLGAVAPFLRPPELSRSYVDVWEVVRWALVNANGHLETPDVVVLLEETYPLRTGDMIDAMVAELLDRDLDAVIAAREEPHALWLESPDGLEQIGQGFMPRHLKETRALVGLVGLGCATYPALVRAGDIYSGDVGLLEIEDKRAAFEVRDDDDAAIAEHLLTERTP